MSSPEAPAASVVATLQAHLADVRGLSEGLFSNAIAPEDVPTELVQALLAAGIRAFYAKRAVGSDLAPVPPATITATEAVETIHALLKAVQLEVFELNLWSSWGRA